MNGKKVTLWSLYNFGGAIVEVVFILYFSQWLVVDRGVSDLWFNATLIGSSALLLLFSPLIGGTERLPGLRLGTLGSVACFAAVGIITIFYPAQVTLAAILFTIGLAFYLFGGIFWCALLPDLARPERFGYVSGWGQFADWIGEIFGLLVTLPLIGGTIILFGVSGRAQMFLPATILFLLFALPMLLFYREPLAPTRHPRRIEVRTAYRDAFKDFSLLCRSGGLGWFFLAFFFFNDAIITAANNFPVYLQEVFGVPDTVKSFLLLGILATSAFGALVGGKIVDSVGARRALFWNLAGWLVILPIMGATTNFDMFTAETMVMGLGFGSVWVIARTIVTQLAPAPLLNRAFTYYTLMERFATLIGPLSWGLIVALTPAENGLNYRIAILCMTIFVALGLFVARKIPTSGTVPSLLS